MIKQIITKEQLYAQQDTPTGELFVDAVVQELKKRRRPTVTSVAKAVGANKDILSGVVKILVGVSLKELIQYWRSQKIMKLLTETDLPFEEVAKECGLSNYDALHRVVEREYGKTLVEVREQRKRKRWQQNY